MVMLAVSVASADPPRAKDRNTAGLLTFMGTMVPLGVVLIGGTTASSDAWRDGLIIGGSAGFVLGPSAGHWYAGEPFSLGLGIRLAGGAGLAYLFYDIHRCGESCADGPIVPAFLAGAAVI